MELSLEDHMMLGMAKPRPGHMSRGMPLTRSQVPSVKHMSGAGTRPSSSVAPRYLLLREDIIYRLVNGSKEEAEHSRKKNSRSSTRDGRKPCEVQDTWHEIERYKAIPLCRRISIHEHSRIFGQRW